MAQRTESRPREDTEEANEYRVEEVVDGTVRRITGAGNFIVYPVGKSNGVRTGNPVRIVVAEKLEHTLISLEAIEEHMSAPISSDWAIVVSAHESIERCRVFYNDVQLSTIDHMAKVRSELRMPRDSVQSFHIPDSMQADDAYLVKVMDGDRLLRSTTFGSIRTPPNPRETEHPKTMTTTTTTTTS